MDTNTLKLSQTQNFINGKFEVNGEKKMDVFSPLTGEVVSQVPLSGYETLDKAVKAAEAAFPAWSNTTIKERVQIFYKYRTLLEKHRDELAELVHIENGKMIGEAAAEVDKSIELVEFACSLPQIIPGEIMEVSKGVECRTEHVPLGIVASITPFNFPNMVPNWTIPNAIALGNCMILKPSENVPVTVNRLAELLKEAGLPNGVFNIVNGGKSVV